MSTKIENVDDSVVITVRPNGESEYRDVSARLVEALNILKNERRKKIELDLGGIYADSTLMLLPILEEFAQNWPVDLGEIWSRFSITKNSPMTTTIVMEQAINSVVAEIA